MTDSEAFAFHFAELDRRGLDGPVPEGWNYYTGKWSRRLGEGCSEGCSELCDCIVVTHSPHPIDLQALAHVLTQALADAGNLTIHTTRDGTNTVTTPAFAVHRKPLLAGLVLAYWKMRGDG